MIIKKILYTLLLIVVVIGLESFFPVNEPYNTKINVNEPKSVSYTLENSLVNRYLHHADTVYSDSIGRVGISVLCYWLLGGDVSPYMYEVPESGGRPMWAEQCAPVNFFSSHGQTILISTNPFFNHCLSVPVESDTVSLYNLVPQTVYWYKIIGPDNKILSKGLFKTQGHLRMIKTEKVLNVRDIGGWKCDEGRLSYGKIFRGATLEGATSLVGAVDETDIEELVEKLGIRSEIDLREEAKTKSSPLGSSVEYNNIVLDDYMYLMENIKSGRAVNSGTYYKAFANLIDCIISNMKSNKGTYIHCLWGADRTGTVIALLEALCGVSEADIVKDWELTSFNAVGYRKYINVQSDYKYKNSNNETVIAPSELRAVFDYLYNNYGGINGASIKEQVVAWIQDKIYCDLPDKGASIIDELRGLLIDTRKYSPIIIKDLSKETRMNKYSCTNDSTFYWDSMSNQYVDSDNGGYFDSDMFCTTGFVECEGYDKLLVNVVTQDIAAFYDKDKKFIGGIKDASIHGSQGCETVLFDYREYDIPSDAVYVKLNMAKNSDWTAVLSEESLLE